MYGMRPSNEPAHPWNAKPEAVKTNPFHINDFDNNILKHTPPAAEQEIIRQEAKRLERAKMPVVLRFYRFFLKRILARFSKKFKALTALGDSIDTLSDINANVDELIMMRSPYGESARNYEKLTAYLGQANKICSAINKVDAKMLKG
jgi:hypothetical protein